MTPEQLSLLKDYIDTHAKYVVANAMGQDSTYELMYDREAEIALDAALKLS